MTLRINGRLSHGAKRTRTADFHNAIVTLYQLSYSPLFAISYHRLIFDRLSSDFVGRLG